MHKIIFFSRKLDFFFYVSPVNLDRVGLPLPQVFFNRPKQIGDDEWMTPNNF